MHEEVSKLLFELGSEDRLGILNEIEKTPVKQSQLAQKLSTTIQEVARQCLRLEDAGLIEKHPDSKYGLTGVGKVALSLISSFRFLSAESEYFGSHDSASLPLPYIERMGELLHHKKLDHINDSLEFQQRVIKESQNYVWFMSDQPVGHSLHTDHSNFSQNVRLRLILPKTVDTGLFRSARNTMSERLEIGLLDEVKIVIAMNEKIAGFALPSLDGRADYSRGFTGDESSFHGWCEDLFSYYWERSTKKYSP